MRHSRTSVPVLVQRLKNYFLENPTIFVMVAAFIIWGLLFKDFLLGQYRPITDAANYYEHVTYFWEHLSRGVYPFWDPTWEGGVPAEFFMRRIGEFNPFYGIIFILHHMLGWPSLVSYYCFMGFYYFLGAIGMYLVAKEIFNDEMSALVNFLLFLFSSMGTLVICSFTVLIFTPMAWLMFFLLSFVRKQERWSFLGAVFCLMILFSTYIPFYFLTILGVLFICTVGFYFRKIKGTLDFFLSFFQRNRIFSIVCLFCLALSIVPSLLFHQEVSQGDLVLGTRHYNAPTDYFLSVPVQRGQFGGIIPHLVLDEILFDARNIRPSHVYVPCFIFVLLFLGFAVKFNKKLAIFFTTGFLIFIISIYDAPLYKFLYQHVFYFKYFRNYQFFFWIGVLPFLILLATGHFYAFMKERESRKKAFYLIFIVVVHAAAFWILWQRHNTITTSYIALSLSLVFFLLSLNSKLKSFFLAAIFLLILIAVEPAEVYHYLKINTPITNSYYRNVAYRDQLRLPTQEDVKIFKAYAKERESVKSFQAQTPMVVYYSTRWTADFNSYFDWTLINDCMAAPLVVYDNAVWGEDQKNNFDQIGQTICSGKNLVYLSADGKDHPRDIVSKNSKPLAEVVTEDAKELKVLFFSGNTLKLRSNFDSEKVLVYYDNYYPRWKAYVDGKNVPVWRANLKYKAVFVPKGEAIIEFRFAEPMEYVFKFFMIGLFGAVFIAILWLWFRSVPRRIAYDKK